MSPELVVMLLTALFAVAPGFLTEVLTKANAPRWVKSTVAVVLSAGSATLAQFVLEPSWDWKEALLKFAIAWAASLLANLSGMTKPVQTATARFGVGSRDDVDLAA